jgi:hypothetical protein
MDWTVIPKSADTTIKSWNGFRSYGNPFYYTSGGGSWGYSPYVEFDRTKSSYFDAGSKVFSCNTNGGFTALMLLSFTGSAGSNEHIFDFGNVYISRDGVTSDLLIKIKSDANVEIVSVKASSIIVQGEWALFSIRYKASTKLLELFKNGVLVSSSTATGTWNDFTATNTYIGKSYNSADAYFNGLISGIFVYDRSLTNMELASASNHLTYLGSLDNFLYPS